MASPGESSSSKDIDSPIFRNADTRWCGREESVLLDGIDTFGYGNWELIADQFKFECADKNFTVQDIINHCNLIFGRNALGAVWDSKILLERRTFICDHTGPEDDALNNSSDINAAKNLTPEQLNSIGYMPLREDFQGVKEHNISSLIPEIRFKDSYLQERCSRWNNSDEDEVEFIYDKYATEDEDDEVEDEDDEVEDEDDEVDDEDDEVEDDENNEENEMEDEDVGHEEVKVENGEIKIEDGNKYKIKTIHNSKADLDDIKSKTKNVPKKLKKTKEERMALIIGKQMISRKKELVEIEMGEILTRSKKVKNKQAMLVEVKQTDVKTVKTRKGKRVKMEINVAERDGGIGKKVEKKQGAEEKKETQLLEKVLEKKEEQVDCRETVLKRKEKEKKEAEKMDKRNIGKTMLNKRVLENIQQNIESQNEISIEIDRNDVKSKKSGKGTPDQDKGIRRSDKNAAIKKQIKSEENKEECLSKEYEMVGKIMEKYSKEAVKDDPRETTETDKEIDKESKGKEIQEDLGENITAENEEEDKETNEKLEEESCDVDENKLITDILLEAVDMYCKDMRDKALVIKLISCHRLVEHYFKHGKKQTNEESHQKVESGKPVDRRDASWVYRVLKTFARFLEPEQLCNFMKDFEDENTLRAKIDDLRKQLQNPDCAVFHLSSIYSDENKGDIAESSSSDSECSEKHYVDPEYTCLKKSSPDYEKQKCFNLDNRELLSAESYSESKIHRSSEDKEKQDSCEPNNGAMAMTTTAQYHKSPTIHEIKSHCKDVNQETNHVESYDSEGLEQKKTVTLSIDSKNLKDKIPSFTGILQDYWSKNSLFQMPDMTVIPSESSDKTSISVDSDSKIFSEETGNLPKEDNFKETSNLPNEDNFKDTSNLPKEDNFKENGNLPKEDNFKEAGNLPNVNNFNENSNLPNEDDFKETSNLPNEDIVETNPLEVKNAHSSENPNAGKDSFNSKVSIEKDSVINISNTEKAHNENLKYESTDSEFKIFAPLSFDSKGLVEESFYPESSDIRPPDLVVLDVAIPYLKNLSIIGNSQENHCEKISMQVPDVTVIPCESSDDKSERDREISTKEDNGNSQDEEGNVSLPEVNETSSFENPNAENHSDGKISTEKDSRDNTSSSSDENKQEISTEKDTGNLQDKEEEKSPPEVIEAPSFENQTAENHCDGKISTEKDSRDDTSSSDVSDQEISAKKDTGYLQDEEENESSPEVNEASFENQNAENRCDGKISAEKVPRDDTSSSDVSDREISTKKDTSNSPSEERNESPPEVNEASSFENQNAKNHCDGKISAEKVSKDDKSPSSSTCPSFSDESDREISTKKDTDNLQDEEENESLPEVNEASSFKNPNAQNNCAGKISTEEDSSDKISNSKDCSGKNPQQEASAIDSSAQSHGNQDRSRNFCHHVVRQKQRRKLEVRNLKFRKSSQESSEDDNCVGNDSAEKRNNARRSKKKKSNKGSSSDESTSGSSYDGIITIEGLGKGGSFNITGILKHLANLYPGGAEFIINPRFILSVSMVARNGSGDLVEVESEGLNFKIPENSDRNIHIEFGTDSLVMVKEDDIDSMRVLMRELPSSKWELSEDVQTSRKRKAKNVSESKERSSIGRKKRKETDGTRGDDKLIHVDQSSIPVEMREETCDRSDDSTIDEEVRNSAKMDEENESNEEANGQDGSSDEDSSDEMYSDEDSSEESCNNSVSSRISAERSTEDLSEEELEQDCREDEREQDSHEEEYGNQELGEEGSGDQESIGRVSELQESSEEVSDRESDDQIPGVQESDEEITRVQESDEELSGVQELDEEISSVKESDKVISKEQELSDEESEKSLSEEEIEENSEEAFDEQELSEGEGKRNPRIKEAESRETAEEESDQESDEDLSFRVPENVREMKEYRVDLKAMMEDNIDSTKVMHRSHSPTWEVSGVVKTSNKRKRKAVNVSETYNNTKEQTTNSDCSLIPTKRRRESGSRSNDSTELTTDDEEQNSSQMDEDNESNEEVNSLDESNDEKSANEERFSDKISSEESCNNSVSSEVVSADEKSSEQDLYEEDSAQELSDEEREQESCEDASGDQESGEEGSVVQEYEKEVSGGRGQQEWSDYESEPNLCEKETNEHESGEETSDGQESSEEEERKQSPSLEESENEEMGGEENGRSCEETEDHRSSEVSDEEEHNLSVNGQEFDERTRDEEKYVEKELESHEKTGGHDMSKEDNGQDSDKKIKDQEMSDEEKGQQSEEEMRDQESLDETGDGESDEEIKDRESDDELKVGESDEEIKVQKSEETNHQESGDEAREQESGEEETEYEELSEGDSENQESNEELQEGLNERSENLEPSVMETEQILAQKETKIKDLSNGKTGQKLRNENSASFNATPAELTHKMACNKESCIEVSGNDSNAEVAVNVKLNKLDIEIEKEGNHELLNDKRDNCILTVSEELHRNPSNSVKVTKVKLGSKESTVTKGNEKDWEILGLEKSADLNTAYHKSINKVSKESSTSLEMTSMEVDEITPHDAMDIEVYENETNKADSVQESVSIEKRTGKQALHISLSNKNLEIKSCDGADSGKSVCEVSQVVSKNEVVALESSEDEVYEVMDEEAINKQSEGVKGIQIDLNEEVEGYDESENRATDDELESPPAEALDTKESKELEGGTDNESIYELEEDDESGTEENRMIIHEKSDHLKDQDKTAEEGLSIRTDSESVKELDHQDRF